MMIRNILCRRLSPYYRSGETSLLGLEEERKCLKDFLISTIVHGQSNSLVIVGPSGSGKSALLECALDELPHIKENLVRISLNGFVHTDDWIALQSIAEQLGLKNEASTVSFKSFDDALTFLLGTLQAGNHKNAKAILFVLDEFDLFCHHKKQTLLYNLFQIVQSHVGIAVIGLTCKPNVVELLEKRMCSRHSHRKLDLFGKPFTFQDYLSFAKHFLQLDETQGHLHNIQAWNKHVEDVLQEPAVKIVLRSAYDKNKKDVRALKNLLRIPVCGVNEDHPHLEPKDFVAAHKLHSHGHRVGMLMDLPLLELSLVVAAFHVITLQEVEHFNFETVYSVYQNVAKRMLLLNDFNRPVVFKAFEQLKALEFIVPVSGRDTDALTTQEFVPVKLAVESKEIQDVLQRCSSLPTEFKQWASNAIMAIF